MDIRFLLGAAVSKQLLGRIARAQGALPPAQRGLEEAFRTFGVLGARFELRRTRLELAALVHAQGYRESVVTHLHEARSLLTALQVPGYIERTDRPSERFGISLSGEPV